MTTFQVSKNRYTGYKIDLDTVYKPFRQFTLGQRLWHWEPGNPLAWGRSNLVILGHPTLTSSEISSPFPTNT